MKKLIETTEIRKKGHVSRLCLRDDGEYILQLVKVFKNGKEVVIQGYAFDNKFTALRHYLYPIHLFRQYQKHN